MPNTLLATPRPPAPQKLFTPLTTTIICLGPTQSHSNSFQFGCVVSARERTSFRTSFQKQTSKAENMPRQKNFSGKTVRFVETGKFPVV